MAISCILNKGLSKSDFCGYQLNQITEIYLGNYSEVTATLGTDDYTVASVTGKWYKIEPSRDTASYNDTLVVGGNGNKYRTHTLTFNFNGEYTADLAKIVDELSLGRFVAVLHLANDSAIMLGRTVGLEASAMESLTEAATDGNSGITVTLEANVAEAALVLSSSAFDTVRDINSES